MKYESMERELRRLARPLPVEVDVASRVMARVAALPVPAGPRRWGLLLAASLFLAAVGLAVAAGPGARIAAALAPHGASVVAAIGGALFEAALAVVRAGLEACGGGGAFRHALQAFSAVAIAALFAFCLAFLMRDARRQRPSEATR